MRKSAIAAALLMVSAGALAETTSPNAPVFTTKAIQEAAYPWRFIDTPLQPRPGKRVRFHFGWMEIKTRFGPLRIIYLPITAPLQGSPGSRDWNQMPNAFVLTGMTIPQKPPREDEPKKDIRIKADDDRY